MKCPICSTEPAEVLEWGSLKRVECPRCGNFALLLSDYNDLPEHLQRDALRAPLMSHTIRRMQRSDKQPIKIRPNTVKTYWSRGNLPASNEQADQLILWIGDNQQSGASGATAP